MWIITFIYHFLRRITHIHPKFNSLFLDAIRTGQHELTPQTLKKYLEDCEQKAWDFDIPKLNAEAQRLLQEAEKKGP